MDIPSNVPRVYCPYWLILGTDLSDLLTSSYKELMYHDNDIIITH